MIKRKAKALAIAFIVALLPTLSESAAHAADPCHDDAREFCQNLEPGHGALQRCLQEHSGDLSSACRALLQERKERAREGLPKGSIPLRKPPKEN